MNEQKNPLVLIFGATGNSGFHIANKFLTQGYPVRIVARSKQKVGRLFKERQIGFQSIIEGELNSQQTLKSAFASSDRFGTPKIVVSSLGKVPGSGNTEEIEFTCQVRIIEKCKQVNVQKYIFVTAALIQRPWNFITFILDCLIPDVYYWKAKAQNYLRRSGINYAIIRPTQLVGGPSDETLTHYQVGQGDTLNGKISRFTLAQTVYDSCTSNKIPGQVTFQCTGTSCEGKDRLETLKRDAVGHQINYNYRLARNTYRLILVGLLSIGAYLLISKFSKNSQN